MHVHLFLLCTDFIQNLPNNTCVLYMGLPCLFLQIMATYRLYKALYPFEARDHTELSMLPDDQLIVYMNEDGTWPNENAWMKGKIDHCHIW